MKQEAYHQIRREIDGFRVILEFPAVSRLTEQDEQEVRTLLVDELQKYLSVYDR